MFVVLFFFVFFLLKFLSILVSVLLSRDSVSPVYGTFPQIFNKKKQFFLVLQFYALWPETSSPLCQQPPFHHQCLDIHCFSKIHLVVGILYSLEAQLYFYQYFIYCTLPNVPPGPCCLCMRVVQCMAGQADTPLHCINYIKLHFVATVLHCIALLSTTLYYPTLHCTAVICIVAYYPSLPYTTLNCTVVDCTVFPCTILYYPKLPPMH